MERTLRIERLRDAFWWRREERASSKSAFSLAIASGKGGTGKSVISASLAARLVSLSHPVILFDADLGVGNAHILQGVSPIYTTAHVLSGTVELADVELVTPSGVKILPAGSGVAGLTSLNRQSLQRLAQGFESVERHCEFLLIDSAAGISDQTLHFALASDLTLLIATPDITSLTDAYALVKLLHQRDPHLQMELVINRCRSENEALVAAEKIRGVAKRFLGAELPLLGWIPEDPCVRDSIAKKVPFYKAYPAAAASTALTRIADQILSRESSSFPKDSFASRLQRKIL